MPIRSVALEMPLLRAMVSNNWALAGDVRARSLRKGTVAWR